MRLSILTLFAFSSLLGLTERTASATTASSTCSAAPEWTADVAYSTGDYVVRQGKTYRCVQGHTALSVWPPEIVPALWAAVTDCSSAAPTAPPPSPPAATPTTPAPPLSSPLPSSAMGGGGTEYAPYFYTWGWGNPAYAFTSLVDLKAKSNLRAVTLAFVLSSNGCNAGMTEIEEHKRDVAAFQAAGGRIKASFGGANGTYLETTCTNAAALTTALKAFVDKTGIVDLDFDVEQSGAMTSAINQTRATALRSLQRAKPNVKVSFTLAALPRDRHSAPGGLSAPALEVVKAAVAGGVAIHRVNLMTMDYGPYYSNNGLTMGELTESALIDANAQLRSVMPTLTEEQAWGMLGATPMIGLNDVAGEVFQLTDAQRLARFARQKRLGLISFWAINRDQACTSGLAICSGKNRGPFDFHNILKTVE